MTKGSTNYTWTRGRLLSQYGSVSFQYDGEGFRRKKVNGNDTTTYYYQDGRLLSEKHSDTDKNLYFVYNGNEIVGFLAEDDTLYYYRKDVFGNVVAVYDLYGEEVASYTYDAWGNCTIGTNVDGLADLNPIRYRGYYYDKETQLYYLQTRYYDPATGRFISSDTVKYLAPHSIHGLNLYAYCFNNPVMGVAPTGHDAIVVVEHTGLPILGHIEVYVQDKSGTWYNTEYLNDSYVYYKIMSAEEMEDEAMQAAHGKYHQQVTIKGDYSGVVDSLMQHEWEEYDPKKHPGHNRSKFFGSYNLLFNSCQTYALTILREGTSNRTAVNKYIQGPRAGITAIPSVFHMNLNAIVEEDAGNGEPKKLANIVSNALYVTFAFLAFNPIFGLAVAGFYLHHHIVNGG